MLIVSPAAALYSLIVEVLKCSNSELRALGNDFSVGIVLDALRNLVLSKSHQAVNEHILKVVALCLVLLVNLLKGNLILFLALASLDSTREELLVYNDTAQ